MSETKMISLDQILADEEFNCRGKIQAIDVTDLARDIQENGLHQPVLVCPNDVEGSERPWKLLAGFRRYMAHRVLGLEQIHCMVKANKVDPITARIINLSENLNRKELNIVQEAKAIAALKNLGCSRDEVARRLNKKSGWVQTRFQVLELPEEIQDEIAAGVFVTSQIKNLYSIMKQDGVDKVYAAAKVFKKARESGGRTITIPTDRQKKAKKCHKKPGEINFLMEHMLDTIGPGAHTYVLAWVLGNISYEELYELLDKEFPGWKEPQFEVI